MAKSNKVTENLQMYEQIYFTHDKPVPLKGHLQVYPALVKDYNIFYSLIDIFTLDKNKDPNGITMSNLDYFIHLMQPEQENSDIFTRKVIDMFELIFHIKNGLICECDENHDTFMTFEELYNEFSKREKELKDENPDVDAQTLMMELFNLRKCPKCVRIVKILLDTIRYPKQNKLLWLAMLK